jgi:hypothetical protein
LLPIGEPLPTTGLREHKGTGVQEFRSQIRKVTVSIAADWRSTAYYCNTMNLSQGQDMLSKSWNYEGSLTINLFDHQLVFISSQILLFMFVQNNKTPKNGKILCFQNIPQQHYKTFL